MAAFLSRSLPRALIGKNNLSGSRFATIVLADQYARFWTFHSHQQNRRVLGSRPRKLLTCTALVSAVGLGYVLYSWKNDIQQIIKNLAVPNCPIVHAISISLPEDNQNRNKFNFIADVVEIIAPSVVYIEISDDRRGDFRERISNGSGFIISQDGLILTSAHVVNKPNMTVKVRLHDGSVYTGTIEDIDMPSDLATVRIKKNNLPVMKLGTSANIRLGEFVVAIGSPLALNNSITSGVVSSVRQSRELGIRGPHMEYIQTDAPITFGNSGGPLVNLNGEAIGINSKQVATGISFAIPIDRAKEFLKKWELNRKNLKFQEVPKRRYMGITMQTLNPNFLFEVQQYNGYMHFRHGVLVWRVTVGSPADKAGLLHGDIVTHANDIEVWDSYDIYEILEKGSGPINLRIIRKGQIVNIKVEPEDI